MANDRGREMARRLRGESSAAAREQEAEALIQGNAIAVEHPETERTWETDELGNLAEVTVGFVGPMAHEYVPAGVPFLRSLNVRPFRIARDDLMQISEEFHTRLSKSALKAGDVVIVRTGTPGVAAVIPDWLARANCADLVVVRPSRRLDSRFLAYFINGAAQGHIDAQLVGAVQQHFNIGSARQMHVPLPSIREQRAIAEVLGALDDKIELNRRMNRTLEELAAALFRSWFVDFDPVVAKAAGRAPFGMDAATAALFPSSFEDSPLGPIPRGWKTAPLGQSFEQTREALNPMRFSTEAFEHFSLPAFDEGREPKRELGVAIKSNKNLVPRNSVLISKLNPHIPRVWLVGDDDSGMRRICSTEFLVFTPLPKRSRAFAHGLLSSDEFVSQFVSYVTGTSNSHQRVQASAVADLPIVVPDVSCDAAFGRATDPLLALTLANRRDSRTLAALRDTLLPKLLSGEIRLRDAERAVEPAI